MSLGTTLLIVLILMLVGVLPSWPHSQNCGLRTQQRHRVGINYCTHFVFDGQIIIESA